MRKHLAIVALATAAAVVSAQGLMALDHLSRAEPSQAVPPVQVAQGAPPVPAPQPAPDPVQADDAAVQKGEDGHFWAWATVNGQRVHVLVDTGATAVALTMADARQMGLDVEHMAFDQTIRTASGEARAAQVQLDYVSVGGARVDRVAAVVVDGGLPTSLLGMTYLGRLSRFEATPTSLILRP
jgi:aspartyl protease family protein